MASRANGATMRGLYRVQQHAAVTSNAMRTCQPTGPRVEAFTNKVTDSGCYPGTQNNADYAALDGKG